MRIHIACIPDKHIVPRMMQWLVERNDWTIGAQTDPNADVNYFAPYTAYAAMRPIDTLKTGWFTHYEHFNRGKARIWDSAESKFDLRLYTSDVYKDRLHGVGLSAKITAGIDQERFTITKKRRKKGRIGISGIGSGRKGTASKLVDAGFDMVASGKDWDIPSTWYDFGDMPDYYNGLDVYLCMSTIEGVPIPPLEALACGCKIVVPREVGMLNELIDYPGVFHYARGDYDEMATAVSSAIDAKVPRGECRVSAGSYTIDAWCESNAAALELLA